MPKTPNMDDLASPVATPQTFDAARQQLLQRRAARRRARLKAPQFIFERIAADMADRLLMINRRFETALLIAPDGFETRLRAHLHDDKIPAQLITTPLVKLGGAIRNAPHFDLVILCLAHHSETNPVGLLKALKERMVDDGHIITVCFGGESLSSLRGALFAADEYFFGRISARIHPMISLQQNVELLAHCGFNLTMGDRDRLTVNYKALQTLINDLRDMGETYTLSAKRIAGLNRSFWDDVEVRLKSGPETLESDRVKIIYDILWSSGWTPHESQQKPLKPGSAKHHLSEAFKPRPKT